MSVFDAVFCLIGVTAAILLELSSYAEKLKKRGRIPRAHLTTIREHAKWIPLLLIAQVFMLGGTTMTDSTFANGVIGFIVPLAVTSAVSHLILRRHQPT